MGPVLVAAILAAPCATAAKCESDAWAFYGAVRDAGGRPISDAVVFLLLDKLKPVEDSPTGTRGRSFRTNEYGKYQAGLFCTDDLDSPNPCAKKPKRLTVTVSSQGYAMKMQVLKLNNLDIIEDDGVCFVHMPEIRLQKGF